MTLEKSLIRRVLLRSAFVVGTFAIIARPAVAQTPSPALLITDKGQVERALVIVDPLTTKIVGRVPLNGVIHQVAASADGKLAFVTITSYGKDPKQNPDDVIAVIDLGAQKVLRLVEVGRGSFPHAIVCAGGKVYFTAEGYKVVARYDPASNQIDWMQGTGHRGGHNLAISKDLSKFFMPSLDPPSITVIESWDQPLPPVYPGYSGSLDGPRPFWKISAIPVGVGPEGTALSPDEKEVWALTRGDGSVSIIDVATRKVSQAFSLKTQDTRSPHSLAFTPDGKRVLVCTGEGDILILDAATRKEIKRVNVDDAPGVVAKRKGKGTDTVLIAPDSSRAYVSVSDSNYVAILDLKTLELTGSITTADAPEGLAWAERK